MCSGSHAKAVALRGSRADQRFASVFFVAPQRSHHILNPGRKMSRRHRRRVASCRSKMGGHVHLGAQTDGGRKLGVPEATIAAIWANDSRGAEPDDAHIIDATRMLLRKHRLDDKTRHGLIDRLGGQSSLVELTTRRAPLIPTYTDGAAPRRTPSRLPATSDIAIDRFARATGRWAAFPNATSGAPTAAAAARSRPFGVRPAPRALRRLGPPARRPGTAFGESRRLRCAPTRRCCWRIRS